jgi:hypothetical protein
MQPFALNKEQLLYQVNLNHTLRQKSNFITNGYMRFDACDRDRTGYIFPFLSSKNGDFHRLKKFITTSLHTGLTFRKTIIVELYRFIPGMRIP